MRELPIPIETAGDDDATEMIRIWLAHQDLKISLHLGMWEDADDCDIDEREAWGELLADTVAHIANGMYQSHGWDRDETVERVTRSLLENTKSPKGIVTGEYVDGNS